jgi:hypothetical protein
MNTYQYCRIGALVALAGALSARAEVTYVGDDVETDSAWRNPSVVKANDIDADNVYGTLGYYLPSGRRAGYRDPFYNTFTSEANTDQLNGMPSWFTSLSFTNPVQTGRSWGGDGGNFGNLDKVHPAHTGFTGAPILNAGAEFNSPDMALRMTRSNSPAFRLTLIFGNSTEASSWIPGQAVTVDDGAGAAVAVSPDPVFVGTGVTAYQSWDISAGNSDIIIVINGNGGLPRLAGLAVDIAGGVPPSVTSDPAGGTYLVGANVNLSGATAGTAPSYQWFKVGGPALSAGTNRVLNFPSISLDDAGSYYFVANNPAGSATSAVAVITVESALPASLTAYRSAVTGESSLISHYGFELQNARDSKGSNHGTLRGGSRLFGGADKSLEPNAGQVDLGMVPEFQFADGTGTLELWFRTGWDPPTPGSASPCLFACQDNDIGINYAIYVNSPKTQIQLINGFETLTYAVPFIENIWHHLGIVFDNGNVSLVLDGQPLTNQASGLVVNPFALGGAAASSQIASHVPLDGGNNRWIGNLDEVAVYRNALPLTAISAHYALSGQLPEISAQPQNAARFAGEPLTLAVGAIGPLLNYQWYKGGAVIAAATNSMLSFASAALEDAGQYSVVVSNSNGAITSTVATVSVRTPNFPAFEAAVRGEANLISLYTFDTDDPGTLSVSDAKGGKTGTVSGLASYEPGLGGGTNRAFVFDGGSFITLGSGIRVHWRHWNHRTAGSQRSCSQCRRV